MNYKILIDLMSSIKLHNDFKSEENSDLLDQVLDILKNHLKIDSSIVDLVLSDEWPQAVPDYMICTDDEKDKIERANGMSEYIGNTVNKKVLDFGCGEGHLAQAIAKKAIKSSGYDIVKNGNLEWEKEGEYFLTTDFSKIVANGPYDYIVLYDVLDHSENPVKILKDIKSISGPKTEVFVRCHSWMSRHGSHLYKTLNKAWVHLFLTETEMQYLNLVPDSKQKYFRPLAQHSSWFEQAGFKVKLSDIIKSEIEPFFKSSVLSNRVMQNTKQDSYPDWQMSQSFNDYVLILN